jgi:predicted RNA methylase
MSADVIPIDALAARGQQNLFGEPSLLPELSQWMTPAWLCRRIAGWVHRGWRVLEPSCGSGNLIDALLRAGHAPELINAVEIDPRWADHARARFGGAVDIHTGDFLKVLYATGVDVVLMNCPFEDNLHTAFVLHALKLAPVVIGVFPTAFEYSMERDRDLWATKAVTVARAKLPDRVDYGGDDSPSFDSVVLKIVRRNEARRPHEVTYVAEETWRRAA